MCGVGSVWEIFVRPLQFCCKPKAALRKKVKVKENIEIILYIKLLLLL